MGVGNDPQRQFPGRGLIEGNRSMLLQERRGR
jgi:hypothetical protein